MILGLSGLCLVPCYWHRRIEAGDLGSHEYNAWLALLAEHGRAPGLYLVRQWNNVLVDVGLSWLGSFVGFAVAEKVVVSTCVLCFFWGAFALIAAFTQRPPWVLLPAIAMIAYGYTFYAGFMNYYLSVGLAFWAMALFLRGTRIEWILGAGLATLAFIAHPIGFGVLLATVAYTQLAEMAGGRYRWFVLILACLILCGVHFWLLRFRTEPTLGAHGLLMTGADQLMLFGTRYKFFSRVVFFLGSLGFVVAVIRDRQKLSSLLPRVWTPLTLWGLFVANAVLLPGAIWLPQYVNAISATATRMTSVTAIFALCILGFLRPRRWILAGGIACATIFFRLQYQDTGTLNRMEQQAETLVSTLPYGSRVSYTLELSEPSRVNFRHFVDRVCIGKCFAYSNYEPGSGQFRIRISPTGSSIVSTSSLAMELGEYVVRSADLPMAQIYQPDEADLTKLAIRNLTPGEKNGRLGHHPAPSEIVDRLPTPSK